jgi:hypothetical protein
MTRRRKHESMDVVTRVVMGKSQETRGKNPEWLVLDSHCSPSDVMHD